MKTKAIFMVLMLSLGLARAQTVIVGGDTLNGNFNLPGGTGTKTYAVTPEWVNLGDGGDGQVCLNDNEAFDGTHAVVPYEGTARLPSLDTGYSITEGDVFSISYWWRDSYQWDSGDQIKIRLFVTSDNTISGTPTDLISRVSGTSSADNTYELVDQDSIYTAVAEDVDKILFVALDTQDGGGGADGFARIDNFELTWEPPPAPLVVAGSVTESNTMLLSWNSIPGSYYTVMQSTNLVDWASVLADILADSSLLEREVDLSNSHAFFQILKEADLGPLVDTTTPRDAQPNLVTPTGDTWVLDFSDEFNGTSVDTSKWTVDNSTKSRAARTSRGIDDWWWKPQNVSVSGGDLILAVTKQDHNTMYCGSINSNNKYEPQYGYLEARIQVADTTKDTHTAFWMQGDNMSNVDGTAYDGAEVDIFESAWFGDYTKSVVHYDGYGGDHKADTRQWNSPGIHDGYHTFGLEWDELEMKIYYDGVLKVTYGNHKVPRVPEYLWLSDGASFGDIGDFETDPVGWLTDAKVDYVRVWKSQ